MPRTTLLIENDAMTLAKAYAERHRISLGEAVSTLVRHGADRPLETFERNGIHVAKLSGRGGRVTAKRVNELLDEGP
jgi:hypothetical protein